jgi:hypothetical protein
MYSFANNYALYTYAIQDGVIYIKGLPFTGNNEEMPQVPLEAAIPPLPPIPTLNSTVNFLLDTLGGAQTKQEETLISIVYDLHRQYTQFQLAYQDFVRRLHLREAYTNYLWHLNCDSLRQELGKNGLIWRQGLLHLKGSEHKKARNLDADGVPDFSYYERLPHIVYPWWSTLDASADPFEPSAPLVSLQPQQTAEQQSLSPLSAGSMMQHVTATHPFSTVGNAAGEPPIINQPLAHVETLTAHPKLPFTTSFPGNMPVSIPPNLSSVPAFTTDPALHNTTMAYPIPVQQLLSTPPPPLITGAPGPITLTLPTAQVCSTARALPTGQPVPEYNSSQLFHN